MNAGVAIAGGLIGGLAMVAVLYPAMWMLPHQMKMNLLLIVGTMFAPVGASAYALGFAAHMMMSAGFGVLHGALIDVIDVSSGASGAGYGALFGLGHALIAGAALGMMPMLHPRMRSSGSRLAFAGGSSGTDEELLDPPGMFGLNYPPMTVMGFFALHAMFGVIVGFVYGTWA